MIYLSRNTYRWKLHEPKQASVNIVRLLEEESLVSCHGDLWGWPGVCRWGWVMTFSWHTLSNMAPLNLFWWVGGWSTVCITVWISCLYAALGPASDNGAEAFWSQGGIVLHTLNLKRLGTCTLPAYKFIFKKAGNKAARALHFLHYLSLTGYRSSLFFGQLFWKVLEARESWENRLPSGNLKSQAPKAWERHGGRG